MSPMVLFEAVWLESPASQSALAKVVEGFGSFWRLLEAGLFFWALARVWDLTALKALGRGPGRPSGGSWRGPPAAPAKKHEAPPEQMHHGLGF